MKKILNERGVVIVEATFIFPIMFLVIFFMLVAGNAYYQKCRVESFVSKCAIDGAANCADPLLDDIEENKTISVKDIDIQPYRYFLGGMSDVVSGIKGETNKQIDGLSTGLFSGMTPEKKSVNVKFNNSYIYSSFSVEVEYNIVMPVRLLFEKENIKMEFSTITDVPVSDTT